MIKAKIRKREVTMSERIFQEGKPKSPIKERVAATDPPSRKRLDWTPKKQGPPLLQITEGMGEDLVDEGGRAVPPPPPSSLTIREMKRYKKDFSSRGDVTH